MLTKFRKQPALHPMRSGIVAIDVDGTLVVRGQLNTQLAQWCELRRAEGKNLMLWSARGKDYAIRAAEQFGVAHLFDIITGKPEAIVDDKGWSWIKFTRVVRSLTDEDSVVAEQMEDESENESHENSDVILADSEIGLNLNL